MIPIHCQLTKVYPEFFFKFSTRKYVTGFGEIGLNAANKFFQYPRVKPYGSIFFEKIFYGRNG